MRAAAENGGSHELAPRTTTTWPTSRPSTTTSARRRRNFVSGEALVAPASRRRTRCRSRGALAQFDEPSPTTPIRPTTRIRSGRTSGRASRPSAAARRRWRRRRNGAWFAGTADGGVWRSRDQGQTGRRCSTRCRRSRSARWPSTRPTARCGSAPARPTCPQDSYAGTGVYRSTNDGNSWTRVWAPTHGDTARSPRRHVLQHRLRSGRRRVRGDRQRPVPHRQPALEQWTEVLDPAGADRQPAVRPAGDRRRGRSRHQRRRT